MKAISDVFISSGKNFGMAAGRLIAGQDNRTGI